MRSDQNSNQAESPDATARDRELRRMLVATASAASARPRRRFTIVASIAAFTLAGALTGGAVSTAALNNEPPASTIDMSALTTGIVYDDAELFGTPFILSGRGTTTVDLGEAPEGATRLALAFRCADVGHFATGVDARKNDSTIQCSSRDLDSGRTGGSGYFSFQGTGRHVLTITTEQSNRFTLVASWAAPALEPEPSEAQQAALADGVVTEAEYRAGFVRYSDCMTAAGYPLQAVDDRWTIMSYSNSSEAVSSGKEGRCYALEFAKLDASWQIAHSER